MSDGEDANKRDCALVGLIDPDETHSRPWRSAVINRGRVGRVESEAAAALENPLGALAPKHITLVGILAQRRDQPDRTIDRRLNLLRPQSPVLWDALLLVAEGVEILADARINPDVVVHRFSTRWLRPTLEASSSTVMSSSSGVSRLSATS